MNDNFFIYLHIFIFWTRVIMIVSVKDKREGEKKPYNSSFCIQSLYINEWMTCTNSICFKWKKKKYYPGRTGSLGSFATSKHTILHKLGELRCVQVRFIPEMIDMWCGDKVASSDLTSSPLLLRNEWLYRTCWNNFVCRAIDI